MQKLVIILAMFGEVFGRPVMLLLLVVGGRLVMEKGLISCSILGFEGKTTFGCILLKPIVCIH
jgi:hypothetical protein